MKHIIHSFITSNKKKSLPNKNQSRGSTKWKLAYIYCSVKWRNKKGTKTTNVNFTLKSYLNGLQFIVGSSAKMNIIFFFSQNLYLIEN